MEDKARQDQEMKDRKRDIMRCLEVVRTSVILY